MDLNVENQIKGDSFVFGPEFTNPNKTITWNPDDIVTMNPHLLICGLSGSGKTTLLKQITKYLQNKNKHIYLIDLQGDLALPRENEIEFTAWDAKYGINPFEFDMGVSAEMISNIVEGKVKVDPAINSLIKNAGPIVQVREIVEIVRKNFFKSLGSNQDAMLADLLLDTYRTKGIIHDDYTTWLNPLPDISDTKELISNIETTWGLLMAQLKANKVKMITTSVIKSFYSEILNDTEREFWDKHNIDPIKYLEKTAFNTVKGLEFHINVLAGSGVFHSNVPPVKPGLNRLNMSGLRHEIQRFMSDIFIGKIFRACKLRGEYSKRKDKSRGERCDTYIIVDEGKLIVPSGRAKNDPYSYLNRIITEARKYGLALIIVVQSPEHLPAEFLRNVYMQVILTMNPSDYDTARKCFDLRDKEMLKLTNKFGVGLVKTKAGFRSAKFPWYDNSDQM